MELRVTHGIHHACFSGFIEAADRKGCLVQHAINPIAAMARGQERG